jgi:ABC-type multidrug transport system fused ATPase/permease subunit
MAIFIACSESNTYRVRKEYLRSVIRKDISWFDYVGSGEVVTRLGSDALLLKDAVGEKIPLTVMSTSTFVTSFVVAFYRSWKLTLVMLSTVPLLVLAISATAINNSRSQKIILQLYATAGTIANESISFIRTVTSFNAQIKRSNAYNESLLEARKTGVKKALKAGIFLGLFSFFLYCTYSLTFWYGHILLMNNEVSTGSVINILFVILVGCFAVGNIAPNVQALSSGISASSKIFETIDHIPNIDSISEEGIRIEKQNLKGKIEFKNVEVFTRLIQVYLPNQK